MNTMMMIVMKMMTEITWEAAAAPRMQTCFRALSLQSYRLVQHLPHVFLDQMLFFPFVALKIDWYRFRHTVN